MNEATKVKQFIEEYMKLKTTGTKVESSEALTFLYEVFEKEQTMYIKTLQEGVINFNQELPLGELEEEELEMIIDDVDFINEKGTVLKTLMNTIYGVENTPKEYNAWKGTISEVEVYYVEPKHGSVTVIDEAMFI